MAKELPSLLLEEHRELGKILKAENDRRCELACRQNSGVTQADIGKLTNIRSTLEEIGFHEFGDAFSVSIYFGQEKTQIA